MSTRLTYTSGALAGETDEEFEAKLAEARSNPSEPLPHLIAGADDFAGEPFSRFDPAAEGCPPGGAWPGR